MRRGRADRARLLFPIFPDDGGPMSIAEFQSDAQPNGAFGPLTEDGLAGVRGFLSGDEAKEVSA